MNSRLIAATGIAALAAVVACALLSGNPDPQLFGIRAEFLLFGITLIGVALLHHRTLEVALGGLTAILILRFGADSNFSLVQHLHHEWRILLNLLGLLLGFAVLARHFEQSHLPQVLPRFLPDDWKGGLVLLAIVFVLSAFLDNIAAAMIGGTVAMVVYRGRVDIGFLAAIVAASNAGGAGSVLGDTTTTMMWIDGVAAVDVLHAYAAALPALLCFGVFAAIQQHRFQPIQKDEVPGTRVIGARLLVVGLILAGAIAANILFDFPAAGVWAAILLGAFIVPTDWKAAGAAIKGSLFLLALVLCASLMPVEALPDASWQTTLALGFVSAVFDNIPLTKLALDQGGYDWGVLAYAVGFGGSMIWFGSSAGVALSGMFPEAKSVGRWIWRGWHVVVAYILGFFVLLSVLGWHPHAPHKEFSNVSGTASPTARQD